MRRLTSIFIALLALTPLVAAADASGGGSAAARPRALTASVAAGWAAKPIAAGIKPVLALDRRGKPAVAYLREDPNGLVAFASAASGWKPETVARGYFYGPIGLAFDRQNRPNIAYHDHQATQVDLSLGALAYAVKDGSRWKVEDIPHRGHDGWDSTIAIGPDGVVRAAGVIPSQFNFQEGVLYYELRNGRWTVTPIGSGPIAYEYNVSLAVDPKTKQPGISYYNDRSGDLVFASFDGKKWKIQTVVAAGDAGKFSSLQFDSRGRPHISFFQQTSATAGTVRYAVLDGGTWKVEDVGPLTDVQIGMIGARRNSSLALDAKGVPHVAFSDRKVVRYAIRSPKGWKIATVATAGKRPLGQLVSLQLDRSGKGQLAYYEVTATSPELEGEVVYAAQK